MPKRTPKQARQAAGRRVEKLLPAKPARGGETVVKDSVLRGLAKTLKK